MAIYKRGQRFDEQIQLAVWAGLEIGASELQVQPSNHSDHSATLTNETDIENDSSARFSVRFLQLMFGKIFALDDIRFKHSKLRSYGKTGTRLICNELVLEYMQFLRCLHFITNPTEGDRGHEPGFVS